MKRLPIALYTILVYFICAATLQPQGSTSTHRSATPSPIHPRPYPVILANAEYEEYVFGDVVEVAR